MHLSNGELPNELDLDAPKNLNTAVGLTLRKPESLHPEIEKIGGPFASRCSSFPDFAAWIGQPDWGVACGCPGIDEPDVFACRCGADSYGRGRGLGWRCGCDLQR